MLCYIKKTSSFLLRRTSFTCCLHLQFTTHRMHCEMQLIHHVAVLRLFDIYIWPEKPNIKCAGNSISKIPILTAYSIRLMKMGEEFQADCASQHSFPIAPSRLSPLMWYSHSDSECKWKSPISHRKKRELRWKMKKIASIFPILSLTVALLRPLFTPIHSELSRSDFHSRSHFSLYSPFTPSVSRGDFKTLQLIFSLVLVVDSFFDFVSSNRCV